jgi:Carboxypeptidase regulatory-like domain
MERRQSVWIIGSAISVIFAACGQGNSQSPTAPTPPVTVVPPPAPGATVMTVSITNTGTTSVTFQLGATARLSDGSTLDVTRVAAWDSSDITRASISSIGVVTVLGDGDVDIRAMYQGVTGSSHLVVSLPKMYALSGVVRSMAPDGATVPEAQVRVLDTPRGDPIFTNANGAFNVAALAVGRHLVEVSKTGYEIWETEITIVDRDLQISVALIPTGRN